MRSLCENILSMPGFFRTSFLALLILWYMRDHPNDVVWNLSLILMILLTSLNVIDFWYVWTAGLTSGFESAHRNIVDWGGKWLLHSSDAKTRVISFDCSSNTFVFGVKLGSSVFNEKSSIRMLGLSFFSKFIQYPLLQQLSLQKMELW